MEPQACPYLDTVERKRLDFDMDRICSVTLTAHNVYACLTCGLFFAGRGRATPGPRTRTRCPLATTCGWA